MCIRDSLDTFPHVYFTADTEWDPSIMDDEFEDINEKEKEKQGPALKLDVVGIDEIMYDCFHLGITQYLWSCIPEPEGKLPEDPQEHWNLNDYYDKPIGWQNEYEYYNQKIISWKKKQLKIIQAMNEQELIIWKLKYKRIYEMKKAMAQNKNFVDFHTDELL